MNRTRCSRLLLGGIWLLACTFGFAQSTEMAPVKPAPKPTALPTDPAELLRLANAAFERKEWAKALSLYDRLLQVDPGNPVGTRRKAEAATSLAAQRQVDENNARLAAERKKLPLYVETAKALLQDKNWKDAENYFTKIEAVEPKHPLLLQVDVQAGRVALRRNSLRELLKAPGNKKDLEDAMARLQALSPNDSLITEAKTQIARTELRRSKLQDAMKSLERKEVLEEALSQLQALSPGDPLIAEAKSQIDQIERRRGELQAALKKPSDKEAIKSAISQLNSISPSDPLITEAKTKAARNVGTYAGQTWNDPVSGITYCWIPAGNFVMGSDTATAYEKPAHNVTLTQGFWMGQTEVTQSQWQAVMGSNPSADKGEDRPVNRIPWSEAKDFLAQLSAKAESIEYRLPTEAEWEYACRAGTTGDRYGDPDAIAWHIVNSWAKTHPVSQKQPNAWGLYDMLGNVWEWCEDWYGAYPSGDATDPTGPMTGSRRVARGFSWCFHPPDIRASARYTYAPGGLYSDGGFRVVAVARTP